MKTSKKEFDILQIAKDFIHAIERRTSFDELEKFYHPDAVQTEYPNTLTKNKTVRTIADLRDASDKGKKILQVEHYEIVRSYVYENTVILEVVWTGVLSIPIGRIPAGGEMKAYFAQFFEFRENKIIMQRNYDCFEPFL